MNRNRLLGIVLALAAAPAAALIQPLRINFQGKLINPVTNNPQAGPVNLTLKIWNDPTSVLAANLMYTEVQNGVPLTNGVFSIQIGVNNGIPRDLFLGASAYLGVTVNSDSEMLPRQSLVMSPYAYTANQLSDLTEVRLIAGPTYSTFTNSGNLTVPAGIVASSGNFLGGTGSLYSIYSATGIYVSSGTLNVVGGGGITNEYGIISATGTFTATGASASLTASSAAITGTGVGVYGVTLSTSITFAQSAGNGLGIRWGDGTISTTAVSAVLNRVRVYTAASTTWSRATAVSEGVTKLYVQVIGAGGGGGSVSCATNGDSCVAGGGGGGGYAAAMLSLPSADQTVTVPVGGLGGASGGSNAGAAPLASTSFGALAVAAGGSGGSAGMATGTTVLLSGTSAGGSGTTGDVLMGGSDSQFGLRTSGTTGLSGGGGSAPYGGGTTTGVPVPAAGTATAGTAGNNYGGGGSGAAAAGNNGTARTAAGGAGAGGLVIVWEFK